MVRPIAVIVVAVDVVEFWGVRTRTPTRETRSYANTVRLLCPDWWKVNEKGQQKLNNGRIPQCLFLMTHRSTFSWDQSHVLAMRKDNSKQVSAFLRTFLCLTQPTLCLSGPISEICPEQVLLDLTGNEFRQQRTNNRMCLCGVGGFVGFWTSGSSNDSFSGRSFTAQVKHPFGIDTIFSVSVLLRPDSKRWFVVQYIVEISSFFLEMGTLLGLLFGRLLTCFLCYCRRYHLQKEDFLPIVVTHTRIEMPATRISEQRGCRKTTEENHFRPSTPVHHFKQMTSCNKLYLGVRVPCLSLWSPAQYISPCFSRAFVIYPEGKTVRIKHGRTR